MTIDALAVMRDLETSIAVAAERAVMAAVDGSRMPVAAYAVRDAETPISAASSPRLTARVPAAPNAASRGR